MNEKKNSFDYKYFINILNYKIFHFYQILNILMRNNS